MNFKYRKSNLPLKTAQLRGGPEKINNTIFEAEGLDLKILTPIKEDNYRLYPNHLVTNEFIGREDITLNIDLIKNYPLLFSHYSEHKPFDLYITSDELKNNKGEQEIILKGAYIVKYDDVGTPQFIIKSLEFVRVITTYPLPAKTRLYNEFAAAHGEHPANLERMSQDFVNQVMDYAIKNNLDLRDIISYTDLSVTNHQSYRVLKQAMDMKKSEKV